MTAESITQFAVHAGLVVLGISFLLTVWRVIKGPTLPDRVIALDMLVGIVMGFIALIAIRTGFTLYIDIAISLGLVGFLATVAFARFILSRKRREGEDGSPPDGSSQQAAERKVEASDAPVPVTAVPVAALSAPEAGAPALKQTPSKPALSKSEATKASAAKVKIAKAKAAKKAAVPAEAGKTGTLASPSAGSRAPRKTAVKNKSSVKKETP